MVNRHNRHEREAGMKGDEIETIRDPSLTAEEMAVEAERMREMNDMLELIWDHLAPAQRKAVIMKAMDMPGRHVQAMGVMSRTAYYKNLSNARSAAAGAAALMTHVAPEVR